MLPKPPRSNGSGAGNGNRAEAVNIIIQATDRAGSLLKATTSQLSTLAGSAEQLRSTFVATGAAVLGTSKGMTAQFLKLNQVITVTRQFLSTEVGKTFLSDIEAAAENAINETQSLTDVLSTVGGAGGSFFEGFFDTGATDRIEAKTKKLSQKLAANLVGDAQTMTQDWSNSIADSMDEMLPQSMARSQVASRVASTLFGNDNLLSGALSRIALAAGPQLMQSITGGGFIAKGLSGAMNAGLNNFIKMFLPVGLKEINDATGGALSGQALRLAMSPQWLKDFSGGDFVGGVERILARAIEGGIGKGIAEIDSAGIGMSGFAQMLGGEFAADFGKEFKLSEQFAKNFDQIADYASQYLPNLYRQSAKQLANSFAGEMTAQIQKLDKPVSDAMQWIVNEVFKGEGNGFFKPIREQFLKTFQEINQQSDGLFTDIGTKAGIKIGFSFAQGFSSRMLQGVTGAVNQVDSMLTRTVAFAEQIPQKLSSPITGVAGVFGQISGVDEPLKVFQSIQGSVLGASQKIFEATQNIYFFQAGIQSLQQLVMGGPFDLLIGQNVKLREQLLATQSSLAATNRIFQDGALIQDPTRAIQALDGTIQQAIANIRTGSLELSGVTSNDLIETFQIIAGLSSQVGFNMDQASQITLSMAAAMGTLGVPMAQARQEVTSILQGQIDMNSVMAKSLGLTNEQVRTWQQQGTLFDELTKKLEAFRAGNALASQTLSGISSNIEEVFQEIGRRAGEGILDPILKRMQGVYDYLNQNMDAIAASVENLVSMLFNALDQGLDAIVALYNATSKVLGQIPIYLFKSLSNAITETANAVKAMIPVIQPAINIIAELAGQAYALGGPFLQIALKAFVLQKAIGVVSGSFGVLFQTLPGVGELLFFLTGRNNSLINTFVSLSKTIGIGGAGFLMLGKNMSSIPGLAGMVAQRMGFFGKMLVGVIPSAAGLGISLAGLSKSFPAVGQVVTSLGKQIPGLVGGFASVIANSNFMGGAFQALAPDLQRLAQNVEIYSKNIDNAAFFNMKFAGAVKEAGKMVRGQIIAFGLLGAGVFAALFILDKFIIGNKDFVKGLEKVKELLFTVGKAIWDFLTNPIVVAIGVVTGLSVAIRAGLIPAFMDMAKAFLVDAAAGIAKWFQMSTAGIRAFSDGISNATARVGEFFSGQKSPKQATSDVAQQFKQENDQLDQEIARRQAALAEANQPITANRQESGVIGGNKLNAAQAEQENAATLKAAQQQELDELIQARKDGFKNLAAVNQDAAQQYLDSSRESFVASTDEYKRTVTQKKVELDQVNAQLAKTDPLKNSAQFRELKKQRELVQGELDGIVGARKEQAAQLGQMHRNLANTVADPAEVKQALSQYGAEIEQSIGDREKQLRDMNKGMQAAVVDGQSGAGSQILEQQQALESELNDLYNAREKNAQKMAQVDEQLAAKINQSPAVQAINQEIVELEIAIAKRNALLQQMDQYAPAPGAVVAPGSEADKALQQRQAAQAELDELVAARSAAAQRLGQAKTDVLNPPAMSKGLNKFAKDAAQKVGGTIKQLEGTIKRFTGGTLQELGLALSNVGFENAGMRALEMGDNLEFAGRGALMCDRAQQGLLKTNVAAYSSLGSMKTAIGNAAMSMKTGFVGAINAAKGAIVSMVATLGPTLALMAAIALVTTIIGRFANLHEISTKRAKEWRKALEESRATAENYANALALLSKEQEKVDPKKLEEKRIAQIMKEQGYSDEDIQDYLSRRDKLWLKQFNDVEMAFAAEQKGVEGLLDEADKYGQELLDNKAKYVDEITTLETLKAQLAEANAAGNKNEVAQIQAKIDLQEKLVNAHAEELDAQIKALETTAPQDQAQADRLAEKLKLLIQIRQERQQEAEMKAPELPRLGGAYEQLITQSQQAFNELQAMAGEKGGDPAQFEQKAKTMLDQTKQLLQLGLITDDQARQRFRFLANNVNATSEVGIQAQQALTESYGTEGEKRSAAFQNEQKKIEQMVANGYLTQTQAEQRLTQFTIAEAESRLKARRKAAEADRGQVQSLLQEQLSTIDTKIKELQTQLLGPSLSNDEKKKLQEDLANLGHQRETAITTSNLRIAEINRQLGLEEQQINTEIAQNQGNLREQQQQATIQDYEEANAVLEAAKADGLLIEEAYADKVRKLTTDRLDAETEQLADQKARLLKPLEGVNPILAQQVAQEQNTMQQRVLLRQALGKATTQAEKDAINATIQGLEELIVKESDINKRRIEARNQFYEAQRSAAQQDAQEQQAILEGEKAQGEVTEQEYAQRSLNNTMNQLDREQQLIEQERAELSATDIEGQEALAAKEGELNKRRADAQQQYYDAVLAIADRARKKLLDASQAAELDAQIASQELLNEGDIQKSQADLRRLNAAQKRANDELAIEEQKLADLEAMPTFSDPQKEEERQQGIRDSRMRTQQLTLQIAEGEYRRQELIRAELQKQMDRQIQAAENLGQIKVLALEEEQRRIDAINKTLDAQQKILDARKQYLDASSALLNAQLDVLGKTTRSQRDQREIAELRARIELRMLNQKQELERQSTLLQQEQLRLALEREKSENRIAQIKNQAETAKAMAEYAKVQADPEATPEQIEAARLGIISSMMTGRALQDEAGMLSRQGALQEAGFAQELTIQERRQNAERLGARGNYLDTLRGSERRSYADDLQDDILNSLGLDSTRDLRSRRDQSATADRLAGRGNMPGVDDLETMLQRQLLSQPTVAAQQKINQVRGLTPEALPAIPNLTQYNPVMPGLMGQSDSALVQALNDATSAFQGLQGVQFQQENQIINQFSGQEVNNGSFQRKVEQQIFNTLYTVGDKLQQRRRTTAS